jgi:hypothetical protein
MKHRPENFIKHQNFEFNYVYFSCKIIKSYIEQQPTHLFKSFDGNVGHDSTEVSVRQQTKQQRSGENLTNRSPSLKHPTL